MSYINFKPKKGACVYHHEASTQKLTRWITENNIDKRDIISVYPEAGRVYVVYFA